MQARLPLIRERMRRGANRGGTMAAAGLLLTASLVLAIAMASYQPTDPSLNTAAGGPPRNLFGLPGAWLADLMLSFGGPAAALGLPLMFILGMRLARSEAMPNWRRLIVATLAGVVLVDIALALLRGGAFTGLPAGLGGLFGMGGAAIAGGLTDLAPPSVGVPLRYTLMAVFAGSGLALIILGLGLEPEEWSQLLRHRLRANAEDYETDEDDDEEETPIARPARRKARAAGPLVPAESDPPTVISDRPTTSRRAGARDRQAKLDLGDTYGLPALELLRPPPPATNVVVDKAALERNARLLEAVLDDFHVKGRITEVRPGPVVTMYELEPAAGIKASRVVALADDIARNMSALSARVATIPGRSVIGIELPNSRREAVTLSELIGSATFEDQTAQLPIVLGKNIAGDPVIADLAPMPHLLVAGTTGSGKSVGLNSMILSLLYRLSPDQCRMIMIDPKMLELSIYADIPHLLTPVVTEPAKSIRALKWTVEQMEERYRMMASVGVRALSSFNAKVRESKARGQTLGRRVQTGYDQESGQPIYEEEKLEYEPLPQIVVIVDELADLMMTAGKEVEFLIQRLAQKARAAGIHLIMATQRPSVDVITGVIKANLPTRISFQVTSKIDSRTILGEQGAEQLLGKGDMLYMPGGKQVVRVHGPFVSDEEVQRVADHWRAQGQPDYIQAVTEEPADGGFDLEGAPTGEDSAEDQLYRRAIQIVAESQKASTSYLQRQLRVGYNSAARLIERMEKDGLVGVPDHVGRREVLIDTEGHAI
jgi:S-DNA-T family DNA segregation ATPase FtsK/SpoIIIE